MRIFENLTIYLIEFLIVNDSLFMKFCYLKKCNFRNIISIKFMKKILNYINE